MQRPIRAYTAWKVARARAEPAGGTATTTAYVEGVLQENANLFGFTLKELVEDLRGTLHGEQGGGTPTARGECLWSRRAPIQP